MASSLPPDAPLNFAVVLEKLAAFLASKGHRFGVVGAVALHAYGITRSTGDLDLVVETSAQPELLGFLDSLGYERLHVSASYSNHVHALPAMGRLDFIYVDADTARALFASGRWMELFPGLRVLVPKPEHLVAMKVLAMKNDPSRAFQECADILHLLDLPGVDANEVRENFARHQLLERFDDIQKARAARA